MTGGSPVESPVRGKSHAGFGGAGRGNGPSETADPRPGPTLPICETYGLAKQGGSRFTYTHVRGYHPLVAVVAGTGDVVHSRLRAGPANWGRGAGTFLTECFARVREAGATGAITVRADSGFYNRKVVGACRRAGARFSITAKMTKPLRRTIEELPEEAWVPIPYFLRRGRGGGDHVHPVHQARPDLPAHRASGPSHPRVPAGPVHRVQLPRVRDGPGGRHPSPGGRPPPPRRVREHDPGPQVRGGPEPPSFGAVRGQRRLARSERDRPQPHPVGLPGRPARDPGRHRHGPPPSPGRAGACRALGAEAPPPPADELAMGRAVPGGAGSPAGDPSSRPRLSDHPLRPATSTGSSARLGSVRRPTMGPARVDAGLGRPSVACPP